MTTDQAVIGRILFKDLQYRKYAEFVVQVDAARAEIIMFLDQDVKAIGGFYSGECSVGMEALQAKRLVRLLEKAVNRLPETGLGPNVVGKLTLKWSDLEGPGSKESGITVVSYARRVVLGISPGEESIDEPYVATFDYKTCGSLVEALQRSLMALVNRKQSGR